MKTQTTLTTTWKVQNENTSLILNNPGDIATTAARWCRMGYQWLDVTEHRTCPGMPGLVFVGDTTRLHLGIGSDGLVHIGDPESLAHQGVKIDD